MSIMLSASDILGILLACPQNTASLHRSGSHRPYIQLIYPPPIPLTGSLYILHRANLQYLQFLPSHTNLTMTPTPPTDPPPAPPPLKVPPSRARRQLAARLALHSQQRADSELRNPAGSNSTSAHSNAYSAHDLDDDDDEFGHDHLADPIAHDDDDDDDVEGITFGEPLRASPPVQPRDAHDVDIALLHDAQARGGEGEGDEDGIVDIDHLSKLKGSSLSPPSSHARHLDLDDFANSPAADADDSEDPDDVEMKVALG